MKKVILYILGVLLLLALAFYAFIELKNRGYFLENNEPRSFSSEQIDFTLPKGWKAPLEEEYSTNNGGSKHIFSHEPIRHHYASEVHVFINDKPEGEECEYLANGIISDHFDPLPEMKLDNNEISFSSSSGDEMADPAKINGISCLKVDYTIREEPGPEVQKFSRKGEAHVFTCGNKCVILAYESFGSDWEVNDEVRKSLYSSIKLKCPEESVAE